MIVRRHGAEGRLTRYVVQARCQLLQLPTRNQFAQMAIYRVRDPSQIFAPVYPARAQSAGEVAQSPPSRCYSSWLDDDVTRLTR